MKLVLFSDLHLDAAFISAGENRAARLRRRSLRDTLDRILHLSAEVNADAILCGGDLYEHERFSPDTGAFLKAAFERVNPIRVFLSPGNHDWYGPQSLYHTVDWSPNVHVFRSGRLEPVSLRDGLTLWGAAHCAPANTPGFLDDFRVDRPGVHVALFHGSERGWFNDEGANKTLHAPFDAVDIEGAGIAHAFLGHYHHPRDAVLFTYPGNPEPLTYGEVGDRGVVIATVRQDGKVDRERRKVVVTSAHDLQVDVSGATSEQDVRARITAATRELHGIARVRLVGELAAQIDLRPGELQSAECALDALQVIVNGVHIAYDFDAIGNEPTVRGEFVRSVRAAALAEGERRRILVTGLRALDGLSDLEVD
jgi:DNA repair exonuclease SbcCD nuclease subunit